MGLLGILWVYVCGVAGLVREFLTEKRRAGRKGGDDDEG